MNIGRKSHLQYRRFDVRYGVAQRDSFSKIERDRDRGKLALVVYGESGILRLIVRKSAQGHLGSRSTSAHKGLESHPCCPGTSNRLPAPRDTDSIACRSWRPAAGRTRHRACYRWSPEKSRVATPYRGQSPGWPASRAFADRWQYRATGASSASSLRRAAPIAEDR